MEADNIETHETFETYETLVLRTPIPFIDLRGKSPVDLLRAYPDKAHALISAARHTHGLWTQIAGALLLPVGDWLSHRWLKRTRNPYLHEIETYAAILGVSGVYSLNLCYEWCCTSGAYSTSGGVTLLRVLDWMFPQLGRQAVIALQAGPAGEYYNITWPGMAGMANAMAPRRFAAALNQPPMRKHGLTYAGDWAKNRLLMLRQKGLPPAHLLRQAFERCANYAEAKTLLAETPIAMPAIFILTGAKPGEGCVIERHENAVEIRELSAQQSVSASNHFHTALAAHDKGWWPRTGHSETRHAQSCGIFAHDLKQSNFDWLHAPMLNELTRLAMIADAKTGRLVVQGFEGPSPVTEIYERAIPPEETAEEKELHAASQVF